ncbi:MAG: ATP-binding protein [Alkalispirochaeta sp.]
MGDYLLDVVQNSVEARATRIVVELAETDGEMRIAVVDNGTGMDAETLQRAQDPFFTDGVKHPHRPVGLGIPFLRQMVDATGGTFSLESAPGEGTELALSVPGDHLDLPPTGDLPTVFQQALCFAGDYEMVIRRRRGDARYEVVRSDLVDALGEIDTVGSQTLLWEYLAAQEESLDDTEAV